MIVSNRVDPAPEKIRVILLLPELGIGGAETHVMHLLERLDRSRFAVSLCCLKPGAADWEDRARRLAESYTVLGFRMRSAPLAVARLARHLRRGRYDILHCHLSLADAVGRIAGAIARVPVMVTTEHGKHLWKSRPHLLLERLLLPVTDARICVSRDIIEIRRRSEGTPEEKLIYIPNAVDTAAVRRSVRAKSDVMREFGWGPDNRLLLAVGRLVPAKSYATLAETLSILRGRHPDARCLIVGEGRAEEDVRSAVDRFAVGDIVKLAGSRTDVPDLLAAADIFVLTSIREGLPVSLLEAMAAGKAIVGTSVGGIPDAITDGETGLLVPPGNPAAVAAAVSRLLGDPTLRESLGQAAMRVAEERFSVDHQARSIGEVYETLFDRKARRRERKRE
jgi:glycosyltransferase involved in cell wall biosynthesis